MKLTQYIIGLIVGVFLFTSCEDIIVLELQDNEPRIVIEANINTTEKTATVLITETNSFYDNSDPKKIENATVTILKETGVLFDLTETSPGEYTINDFDTNSGKAYVLDVTVDEVTYSATAIAPDQINLVSLDTLLFSPPFSPDLTFYRLDGTWNDQEGVVNYYRIRAYADGEPKDTPLTIFDDRNLDGEEFSVAIRGGFLAGELARFELMSIDKEYFDYFLEIDASSSQGLGGSNPFNPQGNFNNRALGYFGIFASNSLEIQL